MFWGLFCLLAILPSICWCQALNRAPFFLPTGDMARFAIPEDTPPDSAVYKLQASDPEGSKVFYSISGEYFRVDKDTGVVFLSRQLDRENQDIITVVISVTDEGLAGAEPNTVSLLREIPVLDVNDNPPVFLNRPYSTQVIETSPPGTPIFMNVTVEDKDGGINGEILLSCIPENSLECKTFDIGTEKIGEGLFRGVISLYRSLDYEKTNGHSLTIKAVDRAKDPARRLSATANVAIEVLDIQDQPPIFLYTPYSATVPENTEEGVRVLKVGAQDGDLGDPRIVKLSLVDEHLGCFSLVPINSEVSTDGKAPIAWYHLVTTDTPLDREDPSLIETGGIYSFRIRATELINGELPAETLDTTVTVVVTDVDDQIPEFNQREYHINVSEMADLDSPLPGLNMAVNDRDLGENARFYLSLRDVHNLQQTFAISPKAGQSHTAVTIRVNNTAGLDYDIEDNDKKIIVFDVLAGVKNDYGVVHEVTSSRVFVHLLDANDNDPIFENSSVYISVPEDVNPGSLIKPLAATDKDSDEFGKIRYSLRGFSAARFKTDVNNGGIYVGSLSLDYETQRSYTLTLLATDGGNRTSSVTVYIEVTDVNDNSPKFEVLEYSRTIREHATSFEPEFFIHANDIDGPDQGAGRIKYEVINRNFAGNIVDVNEKTGEIILQQAASSSDTAKGQYELTVRAWDYGVPPLFDDVRVNVRVGIVGNQRPYFRGNSKYNNSDVSYYKIIIQEDTGPNVDILRLDAVDPDGSTSELHFSLPQNGRDNFVIGHSDGVLRTSNYTSFDLDLHPNIYHLRAVVSDSGFPIAESASVDITVTVTDVNNKLPKFQEDTYTIYLKSNVAVNEKVGAVKAVDTDINSNLTYKILKPVVFYDKAGQLVKGMLGAFKVTNAGEIILVNQLVDEVSSVVFNVEVEDVNSENGIQTAKCEVLIFIQSSNNMNPIFVGPGWSPRNPKVMVDIDEEQAVGTVVYTIQTKATGKVVIRVIQNDHNDVFSVNEKGEITVLRRLDYEIMGNQLFNISVRAVLIEDVHFDIKQTVTGESVLDLQHLPQLRYADAMIQLKLKNINDFAPEFERKQYSKRVAENVKPNEVLLTVRAVDFDNDTIIYGVSGENANVFTVNGTGSIFVQMNETLDREMKEMYKLNITAFDGIHRSFTTVSFDILDINDSPPIFKKDVYSAVVPENSPIGTKVTQIEATDEDLGLSGDVSYKILGDSNIAGLFSIDQNTGVIVTNRILTGRGREEPYKITIQASDKGDLVLDAEGKKNSQQLSSEVIVDVYIGDVVRNDGVPIFVRPTVNQKASISENASLNSPVFQVIATDPDDPNSPEGQIRYTFLHSEKSGGKLPFRINEDTGLITTSMLLDRESTSSYQIIVVAEDKGEISQQTTRLFEIEVLDVDDHVPVFKRKKTDLPLSFQIKEEVPLNTEVGLLQCYDDDFGENALIDYIISDGNEYNLWKIEDAGENVAILKVNGRIDRESTNMHLITVKCFKKQLGDVKVNYARPFNPNDLSEIQVQIDVKDIDDNQPKFLKDRMTIGVRPNVPPDTGLLTLQAVDADGDSPPIDYKINNVKFRSLSKSSTPTEVNELFSLNTKTGFLRTVSSLQKFTDGIFEVHITGNNTNDYMTNVTIQVFVLRDRKLSRLVFNKPLSEIKKLLPDLQRSITELLPKPAEFTIFDSQYLIKTDGSLDLSSTSSCFQITNGNNTNPFGNIQKLLNTSTIQDILQKYNAELYSKCTTDHHTLEKKAWIHIGVLVVAALIGVLAILATVTLCCLYARYKRSINKKQQILAPPPSTLDYMSIRSRPNLPNNKLGTQSHVGSIMGSQFLLPHTNTTSIVKSEMMLPTSLHRSSSMLLAQPATQLGSQLLILAPQSTIGLPSKSARNHQEPAQVTYEVVRGGSDNPAYED